MNANFIYSNEKYDLPYKRALATRSGVFFPNFCDNSLQFDVLFLRAWLINYTLFACI